VSQYATFPEIQGSQVVQKYHKQGLITADTMKKGAAYGAHFCTIDGLYR
jgi:hypothetical protein